MIKTVPHYQFSGNNDSLLWDDIYKLRQPVILRGLALGSCVHWTLDTIASRVGDKKVSVHVCPESRMNFTQKNFVYKTIPMNELMERLKNQQQDNFFVCETEKYYLRSLSDNVRTQPALLSRDFPTLSDDLHIPAFIGKDQVFSSVLRLASPQLQLWTHYDVMDNILIQLQGQKRVVLFAPSELPNMYMIGDKSQVVDIDTPDLVQFPKFAAATRYECIMQPSDALFIPALWLHNVTALDTGLAVNVFWRNLDPGLYDSKDVYGNKDPVPASQALQMVQRALALLNKLPDEYSHFYQHLMIASITRQLTDCLRCRGNCSTAEGSMGVRDCVNCNQTTAALTVLNTSSIETQKPA